MQTSLKLALDSVRGVKIPELPEELIQLDKELKSPFASSQNVVRIIEKNTTMAGEVVRIAAAGCVKPGVEIHSIRDAVAAMGFQRLHKYVVQAAMQELFSSTLLQKEIMAHSVEVAKVMAYLTEWVAEVERDQCYMIGLIHNVGSMMYANKSPKNYKEIFEISLAEPHRALQLESESMGGEHTFVGALIAKKWQMPIEVINVIIHHHCSQLSILKDDLIRAQVAMLQLSELVVAEVQGLIYESPEVKERRQSCMNELMINDDVVVELKNYLMTA